MQPWDIKQLWLRGKPQVEEATGGGTDSGVPRGLGAVSALGKMLEM